MSGAARSGGVSVVVPTRDRPDRLGRCLAALADQTEPPHEVIVVDDCSRDPGAVRRVAERHPRVEVVTGAGDGPAAARNLGIARAAGAVVCLTDDDCAPAPDWLAELLPPLYEGYVVAAGRTRPAPPDDIVVRASQTITNHLVSASADGQGAVGFAPTCNLAMTTDTARQFPFDESFPLAAGEDREWCSRLADHGVEIAYVPAARVDHAPGLGWRGFLSQQVRYGRGALHWRAARPATSNWQPGSFYVDLLRAGVQDGWRCGALVCIAQVATAVGLAAEALRSATITAGGAARRPWTRRRRR